MKRKLFIVLCTAISLSRLANAQIDLKLLPEHVAAAIVKANNKPDAFVNGISVLYIMADMGNVEAVKMLLANGANPIAKNTGYIKELTGFVSGKGATPLHAAAGGSSPNVEVLTALLQDDRTDVNVVDDTGSTALHWAFAPLKFFGGNTKNIGRIADLLIENRADVLDTPIFGGDYLINSAIKLQDLSIVKSVIKGVARIARICALNVNLIGNPKIRLMAQNIVNLIPKDMRYPSNDEQQTDAFINKFIDIYLTQRGALNVAKRLSLTFSKESKEIFSYIQSLVSAKLS